MATTVYPTKSKPNSPKKPPILPDADIKIVDAVNRYYILKPSQVNRLLYKGGGLTFVYNRMKQRATEGFLLQVRVGKENPYGQSPVAYMLDGYGRKVLGKLGKDIPHRLRKPEDRSEPLDRKHTLAVNEFLISAELLRHPVAQFHSFIHEKTLLRNRLPVSLPNGQIVNVAPDSFVQIHVTEPDGSLTRANIIHEEDRGTEGLRAWSDKLAGLVAMVNGPFQNHFRVNQYSFAIHVQDEDRCQQLLEWSEKVLLDLHAPQDTLDAFFFSSYPTTEKDPTTLFLGNVWYQAYHREPTSLLGIEQSAITYTDGVSLPPRFVAEDIQSRYALALQQEQYAKQLLGETD